MGFAAGMTAGVSMAESVRKNIRQRAQDKRDTKVRTCTAAADGNKAAIAECLEGTEDAGGIPEEKSVGEKAAAGAAEASEYMAKSSDYWAGMDDDGESYVAYDDVAKLKGQAMSGSFGETGMPDDPRLDTMPPMGGVAAAEGGAIDTEQLPDTYAPMGALPVQQGVAGEPVAPAAPAVDRNSAPPAYPDEVVASDAPRSAEADDAVREQAVMQERNNRPYTVKQMMAVDAQLLRNMTYNNPVGVQQALTSVRARRQQQAVGYINSSKRAYEAGDIDEAKRNARMAFGFLPSGSSLEFKDIQGKTAGATIDEHSGKVKSKAFVLGPDFYNSAEAIMKDPAQWNLWTAKGEREEETHQAAMRFSRAQVLAEIGSFVSRAIPASSGKSGGAGLVGNSGGWKSPGPMQKQSALAQAYVMDFAEDPRFRTHEAVTADYEHFYGAEQNQYAAQYLTHQLTEANPQADGRALADAAANIVWYGSMQAQGEGGAAAIQESGLAVDVVPNGNTPYGYSAVITRTGKDKEGNDVSLRPITVNASPELIAAYDLPVAGAAAKDTTIASRLALVEWSLEYVDGRKEPIFGVPTQAQVDALVSGKAQPVGKDGIEDPDSIAANVGNILRTSKEEAARRMKTEQSVEADYIATSVANDERTPEEVDADSMIIPAEGDKPAMQFDPATGGYKPATPAQVAASEQTAEEKAALPTGASPRMRRSGSGDKDRLTPAGSFSNEGSGTRQGNRYRTPPTGGIPVAPPESSTVPPDAPPERFDMVRGPGPGQPAGIPTADGVASTGSATEPAVVTAMPLDPGAQELLDSVPSNSMPGVDPGFGDAVNNRPAQARKKASPEQLKINLNNYAAGSRANLGAAGTPERAAAVTDVRQRIAHAETGTHVNPWVRTNSPPTEGSTAYGPLQITDVLLADMQRPANKGAFTGAELHMIALLREQAAKFKKYGTNAAYAKLHPDEPLPKSLPGYDPRYDYSLKSEAGADIPTQGGGEDWTPAQKELYMSLGDKMLGKYVEKYGVVGAIDAWRYGAASKKTALIDDSAYIERFLSEFDHG